MSEIARGSKKDGWPARLYRSLAIGQLVPVLGRKRALRGDNLNEEEMDLIPLNERGEVKTESPRRVEQLL